MSYQSIQLVKYGRLEEAFEFTTFEPKDPKADEVQIEVECFGVNYADIMAYKGLYGAEPPLPCTLGYEAVGRVVKIGTACPPELEGKRVVAFTEFGGYSQLVNTSYYGVVPIGDYDGHLATCLATQYVTAYYMSNIAIPIYKGENVLIHSAAGGVGTALIQLLQLKEVNIIAKTGNDNKINYLKQLGVEHCINYNTSNYVDEVRSILEGNKLDVSFNPAGGSTFKKDWKLLRSMGRFLLFGGNERVNGRWGKLSMLNFLRKMGIIIPITMIGTSKTLAGVNMLQIGREKPELLHHCLSEVVDLAKSGDISPSVGKVYKATSIIEAIQFLSSGESTGKIVLEW